MIRPYCLAMACALATLVSCSKNEAPALIIEPPLATAMQFYQDTTGVSLSITSCRKETIGPLTAIVLQGQYADTIRKPNRISLRIIGDTSRTYRSSEIIASYTDSTGMHFSSVSDPADSVVITKLNKTNNGLVTGTFAVTVRNTAGTKSYALRQGRFTTLFSD